ncbi:hypothetical protein C6P46_006120 [Rhodotorula mucilaginosa]|jgi:hypothetical protein|uniref:Uncharacterized protein n=1 Tax=Rhodotorula mucilaginosa TaxID=5537 RepID=A0A9P7B4N2_RHOMI|nr:hypothetical protein C6P46_006120 [Rhodotorula mucilaginosa]
MKPLRMKATNSADEAVLRAEQRAQRKATRKKQKRSRHDDGDTPRAESLTPPRNPPKQLREHDWGPDESALPPEQAYKRTRTDDEFYEALADAQAQDQGVGYYEDELYARQVPAYATYYSSAAAAAAGIDPAPPKKGSWLSNMDDDEYAEYVRAGMWRVKNKAEVERMERAEKERKEREERERRERDKLAREERERIRKLEERKKRKSEEEAEAARARYDDGWRKLQQAVAAAPVTTKSSTATPEPVPDATAAAAPPGTTDLASFPLRFTDFPWPLYPPMAFPPLSWPTLDDISSASISSFLLPDSLPTDKHKAVLRQAVLAYHPDRFERYVLKIPEDKEDVRERVRQLGLRVSQVLNDLSKKSS